MPMKARRILLILVLLLAGLLSFTELFGSEWAVQAQSNVVTIAADDAVFEPWNRVWVAPIINAGDDKVRNELIEALQEHFAGQGINAELAPRYLNQQAMPDQAPIILLVESDYKLQRNIRGWSAVGSLIVQTIGLNDNLATKTVDYRAGISAAGTYTGWVKRATVQAQLIDQLTGKLADSLGNELRKQGQALPPVPLGQVSSKKSGFQIAWPWFRKSGEVDQGSIPDDIEHPLIAGDAEIDYYWQLSGNTAAIYRVQESGVQLEKQLLGQLGGSVKDREFQNAVYDRRQWSGWGLQISHWAVDTDYSDPIGYSGDTYVTMQNDVFPRRVLVIQKEK